MARRKTTKRVVVEACISSLIIYIGIYILNKFFTHEEAYMFFPSSFILSLGPICAIPLYLLRYAGSDALNWRILVGCISTACSSILILYLILIQVEKNISLINEVLKLYSLCVFCLVSILTLLPFLDAKIKWK